MIIIAERINSSRNNISEAIASHDASFIQKEALNQAAAGAHYIDVNAGTFVGEEVARLKWLIDVVQAVTDVPLCIDSPDPEVIREVLPAVKSRPLINSITLEPSRLESVLPLVSEYSAKVIALCQAEDLIAETTEAKLEMAERLVEKVTAFGVPLDHLYIDPLVYPLSTNPQSAVATLEAIERIKGQFKGVHTTCGLTNVSHGLPHRKLVNLTFLVAAMVRGLDSAILDPTDGRLFGALKAAEMVLGNDDFCMGYISAYRERGFE